MPPRIAAVTPSIFGGSLLSLESRIMFDGAAVATASIVNTEQTAQNQAEDSSSAGDAATTDAQTGESSATADQALFDALAALDVSAARQDTLFVSTNVLDYQQLLDGISPNVEAHILDPARDGVEQIADTSSNHSSIDPVNLIGDGTEAGMHLSSGFPIQHSISTSYAEQFQQIGQSLSADAELLVDGSSSGQAKPGNWQSTAWTISPAPMSPPAKTLRGLPLSLQTGYLKSPPGRLRPQASLAKPLVERLSDKET